ncbi:hypothetical protein OWR29_37775 [Actinoplanes sp. Pm04-4]|uniref:Uncharacterized protein n=1 Tax=Paractinoplanes pyxinae TaxID=2997416 RepID=A0ABT4BB87_9ACTN|nr:hypothetical protein [Actinoplanes pyxinae]MCY1143783.1 hypothetical protein [Actinoplanes pyxinae]
MRAKRRPVAAVKCRLSWKQARSMGGWVPSPARASRWRLSGIRSASVVLVTGRRALTISNGLAVDVGRAGSIGIGAPVFGVVVGTCAPYSPYPDQAAALAGIPVDPPPRVGLLGQPRTNTSINLLPGAVLLGYTDGLIELR